MEEGRSFPDSKGSTNNSVATNIKFPEDIAITFYSPEGSGFSDPDSKVASSAKVSPRVRRKGRNPMMDFSLSGLKAYRLESGWPQSPRIAEEVTRGRGARPTEIAQLCCSNRVSITFSATVDFGN